jgi:hypothetical protein
MPCRLLVKVIAQVNSYVAETLSCRTDQDLSIVAQHQPTCILKYLTSNVRRIRISSSLGATAQLPTAISTAYCFHDAHQNGTTRPWAHTNRQACKSSLGSPRTSIATLRQVLQYFIRPTAEDRPPPDFHIHLHRDGDNIIDEPNQDSATPWPQRFDLQIP